MPNSSGFIDFNQQLAATGDEEQRELEAAMSRAEAAQGGAERSLTHANLAARDEHVGLSETASYSDYLKARQNASNAWAAVTSPDANPRSVRGAVANRMGAGGRQQAAGDELQSREQEFGRRNEGNRGEYEGFVRQQSEARAAAEGERARRNSEEEAQNTQLADYYHRMMAPGGQFQGGMNYTSAAQRYLALQQRAGQNGWANGGFDPRSQGAANGREVRSQAYGDQYNQNNPDDLTQSEKRWGSYGRK